MKEGGSRENGSSSSQQMALNGEGVVADRHRALSTVGVLTNGTAPGGGLMRNRVSTYSWTISLLNMSQYKGITVTTRQSNLADTTLTR